MSRIVYQLRIDLVGAKPPIWRRILFDAGENLHELHCAIQNAMGWRNCHLHAFEKNGMFYGLPDDEMDFSFMETLDEREYPLISILFKEGDILNYEYDFGDSWQHKIKLEKILSGSTVEKLPACIKGRNECPPEDIGGLWGYYEFLEIINDPTHPQYEEYADWIGDDSFDPASFDLEEINERLHDGCAGIEL